LLQDLQGRWFLVDINYLHCCVLLTMLFSQRKEVLLNNWWSCAWRTRFRDCFV